jgi:glycosyltransferase involved in cell wall biosynthesis
MKVAIVHYWLVGMRGGEKVVEALCEMFPTATIYTHVYDPGAVSDTINRHPVRTTFIDKLPRARQLYQRYLPLMPMAIEQLDLRGYDLVLSSESGPAKGFVTPPGTLHLCYCHTPMRYLWDMYPDYLAGAGRLTRWAMRPMAHYLRTWDLATAFRVDRFVANSHFVARRIAKYYRREADVVHPPVSVDDFRVAHDVEDYYLMVGQLVPYKRTDLAVEAFNRMGRKLVVIGEGEHYEHLARIAGPNVRVMGRQPFSVIREHYAKCRALIFPGLEDFGIVPVEAMASGRPVIAYRAGGALETVVDGVTGMFFDEQSVGALIEAVENFEARQNDFLPGTIRAHAEGFGVARFKSQMQAVIDRSLREGLY